MTSSIPGLALHTTTPELGLAVQTATTPLCQTTWDLGRGMSHQLHEYLAQFMTAHLWQELAFIAVAVGPGGFTSTRLGVVTARTLGQQLKIPVFGISTLAAVAWQHRDTQESNPPESQTIAVQYPAKRGELFGGIYAIAPHGINWEASERDRLYTPEAWSAALAQYSSIQPIAAENPLGSTVQCVWELGAIAYAQGERPSWAEALPFYGQSPVVN